MWKLIYCTWWCRSEAASVAHQLHLPMVDGKLVLLKCIHSLALHNSIKQTGPHVAFPAVCILQKVFGGCEGWPMQNAREVGENSQVIPSASSLCGPSLMFVNEIPATHLLPAWHSYHPCFNSLVSDFIILIWSPDHLQTTYRAWQLSLGNIALWYSSVVITLKAC